MCAFKHILHIRHQHTTTCIQIHLCGKHSHAKQPNPSALIPTHYAYKLVYMIGAHIKYILNYPHSRYPQTTHINPCIWQVPTYKPTDVQTHCPQADGLSHFHPTFQHLFIISSAPSQPCLHMILIPTIPTTSSLSLGLPNMGVLK